MGTDSSEKERAQDSGRCVLAIDLGSGSLKAAVVSESGRVLAAAGEKTSTYLLPHGGVEQDPEEWWRLAKTCAKGVIRESGVSPEHIVAVSCDSQWSVVVPVDRNGAPLMRAVHWLDTRGGPYNRRVTGGFPSIQGYGIVKLLKWIKRTGLAPTHSGVDSLGHVLFIKNRHPDIYARTRAFLEPMDYLTTRLTGNITASQKTMAPFLLVDSRQWGELIYSDDLMKLAGLDREKFPELIPNDGVVGPIRDTVADELGLNPSIPVVAGTSDTSASAIGSGAVRDFETIVYVGTSMYMTCQIPFKKTDLMHLMTSIPSPLKDRYYLLGEQGVGGKCLEFFLKNIVHPEDRFQTGPMPADAYDRLNDAASASPAGSGGVVFLPWLNGSIVPCEDPNVRGGFMNLSLTTTRNHLSRAIMEGLAFNNRWTKIPAEKFIGRPIRRIRFSGGGALSDVWSQVLADVLGIPVLQVDDPVNATVRGAALLALVYLDILSPEDLTGLIGIRKEFHPDPANKPVYDRMFPQYVRLYKKNRNIFAALNTS